MRCYSSDQSLLCPRYCVDRQAALPPQAGGYLQELRSSSSSIFQNKKLRQVPDLVAMLVSSRATAFTYLDDNKLVEMVRIKPAVPLFVDASRVYGQTMEEACAKMTKKGGTFVAPYSSRNGSKHLIEIIVIARTNCNLERPSHSVVKVRFGSGSGHFYPNPEPEPQVKRTWKWSESFWQGRTWIQSHLVFPPGTTRNKFYSVSDQNTNTVATASAEGWGKYEREFLRLQHMKNRLKSSGNGCSRGVPVQFGSSSNRNPEPNFANTTKSSFFQLLHHDFSSVPASYGTENNIPKDRILAKAYLR
ncbi:hypothetical protein B0H10DRAFT_1958059 [Mycena sp. CBHHK59/15]|nr:hypothetical protein B0H10DRAFT_1958059 [Mycena sp. CBHHK59/15]